MVTDATDGGAADGDAPDATGLNSVDAESSWMDDVAGASQQSYGVCLLRSKRVFASCGHVACCERPLSFGAAMCRGRAGLRPDSLVGSRICGDERIPYRAILSA